MKSLHLSEEILSPNTLVVLHPNYFFFQQHCSTCLKMDVVTVIPCFKAAIKKERNQSSGSAKEPAGECSTQMQDVVSNIYAYQAIHSLWPAVYSCNFPRQICYFTHHPVSAKRKIYQHAKNAFMKKKQIFPSVKLKLNITGRAAKYSCALRLVCTEIKDQILHQQSQIS